MDEMKSLDRIVSGEFFIKIKEGALSEKEIDAEILLLSGAGLSVEHRYVTGTYLVKVEEGADYDKALKYLEALKEKDYISSVEPVKKVNAQKQ
jgi:hypothetical protein